MSIDVSNTPSMYTINVSGSFTFDRTCGVRNDPNMATATVADYTAGQTVNYDSKVYNDGHFWAFYISASGVRRYVDYANTTTDEFFGTDTNSSEPVVPVDDTGTGTGDQGDLGTLTGQQGADVADQTADGTLFNDSGTFTFDEAAAGRAETLMTATHLQSWAIGETVSYTAKVKNDGHYWLRYDNNGTTYYVPYATISPFRYYGTDSNPGDPVYSQGTTTETGTPRDHRGTDTGTPNLTSSNTRTDVGEMYQYPSTSTLILTSNAWGRDAPFMSTDQANQLHKYLAGTHIEYTHKLFNDGHCWVVLKDGQYLPVSTINNAEKTYSSSTGTTKNQSSYSYITNDTGKHLPIHELSPYNYDCIGDAKTDVEDWESAYNLEDIDSHSLPTLTPDEQTAMDNISSALEENADPGSVSIAYIADTHYDSWKTPSTARVLRSMQLMSYYAKTYGVDLMIHGGDLNDGVKPKNISEEDINRAMDALKLGQRPYIVLQGNHDDNSGYARDETNYNGDQVITNAEATSLRTSNFSQWLNIPSNNPNNAVFGTYEVPNSNVTVIVLDGFDMPDYSDPTRGEFRHGHTDYSAAQQAWLKSTLNSIAGNRKIVVFDHISLAGIGDAWQDSRFNTDRFENTHTSSYQPGVTASNNIYNMLSAHQSSFHNILGFFAGHTHRDNNAFSGGIQFTEITCGLADRGDGEATRRLNDISESAWEIIQINPSKSQVKLYRFGYFGPAFTGPSFSGTWTV
ncbi:SH3 domain-containing protein [Secundilactobacillus folii]|uniref:SH3b domain-containing protein n=1 Tax=Secundilactobacillus folii TaxID=2678357 RepID=A0A7X3C4B3_9LACO|nr:SH3 domain-containing protein [Secundilactobacillus folii]MTV83189.1 hypothetical protein [Secundilactobacillus folii]